MNNIEFTDNEIVLIYNALHSHLETMIIVCGREIESKKPDLYYLDEFKKTIKSTFELIEKLNGEIDNE